MSLCLLPNQSGRAQLVRPLTKKKDASIILSRRTGPRFIPIFTHRTHTHTHIVHRHTQRTHMTILSIYFFRGEEERIKQRCGRPNCLGFSSFFSFSFSFSLNAIIPSQSHKTKKRQKKKESTGSSPLKSLVSLLWLAQAF
jgi:hypothetical protein